jgi:putative transposase
LRGYDYSAAGGYFVTIVTRGRACLLGEIHDGAMEFTDMGRIADENWRTIPDHFPNVELGEFIVMPNHVHGIIILVGARYLSPRSEDISPLPAVPYPPRGYTQGSVGAFVSSYKAAVTRRAGREFNSGKLWQRNYLSRIFYGITNILFATRPITNASPVISSTTRPIGMRMRRIHGESQEYEALCEPLINHINPFWEMCLFLTLRPCGVRAPLRTLAGHRWCPVKRIGQASGYTLSGYEVRSPKGAVAIVLDLQSQQCYSINEVELFPTTRRLPECLKIGLGLRPIQ